MCVLGDGSTTFPMLTICYQLQKIIELLVNSILLASGMKAFIRYNYRRKIIENKYIDEINTDTLTFNHV